ncbi:MAG: hypothetical protein Q8O98_00670 [bacterium]|nr:hypothetical protein [bacterium]
MDPKFQSSFIPKGPAAAIGSEVKVSKLKEKTFLGFLATLIFVLTLVLSVGILGYNYYLSYSIGNMTERLEIARATAEHESVNEILRLDARLNIVNDLLSQHAVLSPIFEFLESQTVTTVQFNSFDYSTTEDGVALELTGEARGYAAVALQAEAFQESPHFKNPVFSDLQLDETGNVVFAMSALVDPEIISYKRKLERSATSEFSDEFSSSEVNFATTTATTTPEI